MESDIIIVSDHIEIHPTGQGRFAVVRDGAVYGGYDDLKQAREVAEELAGQGQMTYELIGSPRIESEYCDEWETAVVCDLRRSDGETGDVWICAGVPRSERGTSDAVGTQDGFLRVWLPGDSPACWCPKNFDYHDHEAILDACREAALAAHRNREDVTEENE